MNRFKNILVATDTRLADHPILTAAAELAKNNRATLKIMDVVPEFPASIRRSLTDHAQFSELIAKKKREQLESLAATVSNQVQVVTTKVAHGKASVEIVREVLRGKHDLVMRVAKGQDSRSNGFFGTTGFRLLRHCPVPVWLVSPTSRAEFKHILGCVDTSSEDLVDSELNDDVFALTASLARHFHAKHSVIHAWSIWNEQMVKSRLRPEEFENWELQLRQAEEGRLGEFLGKHGAALDGESVCMRKGEPHVVIPQFIVEHNVDLVVLGTVGRSGLYGMVMGNTAERILNRVSCSVLAIKPSEFRCPIKLSK